LKDVTLVLSNSNENLAYNINKLLKDMDNIATNDVVKDKCETGMILFCVILNSRITKMLCS